MKFVNKLPEAKRGRNRGGQPPKYQADVDRLRANPDKWALWKSFPAHEKGRYASLARQINQGRYAAFRPAGDFEAVVRTQGDKANVYLRYVGK